MGNRIVDWTGKQINYITVLELAPNYATEHNKKTRHKYWKCQCICGNICYIDSGRLRQGNVKSCGCKRDNKNELAGKTFGRITVIDENREETKKHSQEDRRVYWNCICNFCGSKTIRSSHTLLRPNANITCSNCYHIKDIRGEKHGKLTITDFIGIDNKHNALWKCKCECGNEKIMNSTLFHLVYSCGCSRLSIGEFHIKEILDAHNVKYLHDTIYFSDLLSCKSSNQCRYDFIILDEQDNPIRLIEFDGQQHTDPNVGWYSLDIVRNDIIKNEYALSHNIPLVRIPYTLRDTVSFEDLFGDKYLITATEGKEG